MSISSKRYFHNEIDRNETFNYFSNNGDNITKTNCPQEFFPIIAIFAEDSNFELKTLYTQPHKLFIKGKNSRNTKTCELMLRIINNQLIVARIEFINKRKGNMTRLYNVLKRIKRKYKLSNIQIENCNSEEITNWCIKNKFSLMPYHPNCYIDS